MKNNRLRTLHATTKARVATAALTAALLPVTLFSSLVPAAAAEEAIVRDGSSELQAAASCWEVKQTAPTAPSGTYWLSTPQMPAPEQFYCDQETDGGGATLVVSLPQRDDVRDGGMRVEENRAEENEGSGGEVMHI